MLSIVLNISGVHFTGLIKDILFWLSSPFTILALISVGMQINFSGQQLEMKLLKIGLLYKLLLTPLAIYLLYHFVFQQSQFITTISVMGAATGPMNTAAVIAGKYNLNAKLASQIVAFGIPLSLPLLYIIHYFMR